MVFQSGCCYDHVIHVTHHKIPRHSGQSLRHQSLKSVRCIAQAEGHRLPLAQPQFTCKSGLLSVLHPQTELPEVRTQVQFGEELGITKFGEELLYSRYRVRIFYCHRVQVAKSATEPKLPPFFFAITTPHVHGNFEGSIMWYLSNISISARHAFSLCGIIRLAPSPWKTAPSSSSILCSTKLKQPISALCFENTSAFQFKTQSVSSYR